MSGRTAIPRPETILNPHVHIIAFKKTAKKYIKRNKKVIERPITWNDLARYINISASILRAEVSNKDVTLRTWNAFANYVKKEHCPPETYEESERLEFGSWAPVPTCTCGEVHLQKTCPKQRAKRSYPAMTESVRREFIDMLRLRTSLGFVDISNIANLIEESGYRLVRRKQQEEGIKTKWLPTEEDMSSTKFKMYPSKHNDNPITIDYIVRVPALRDEQTELADILNDIATGKLESWQALEEIQRRFEIKLRKI